MSSTACDDQHTPEPSDDLEQQCREARAKAKEMCVWAQEDYDSSFGTTCGRAFLFNDDGPKENGFVFCPYCGKRIETRK